MTKDDILNASIKIISKDGFDKLTLSYLADELKVKKSSIYYHFVSKDEIILSLYSNAKKILSRFTFNVDFSHSSEEILKAVYNHWEKIYQDKVFSHYLSLLEQRYMIDEEAYEIKMSLNLMIEAQSDAVIENLIERKKINCQNQKLLSFLFSSTAKECLKREESNDFILEFNEYFSH